MRRYLFDKDIIMLSIITATALARIVRLRKVLKVMEGMST